MPYAALAAGASELVARYGPTALDAAKRGLAKVTDGRVKQPGDIKPYVANEPARLRVVGDELVRQGFSFDEVYPRELMATEQLRQLREAAMRTLGHATARFAAGAVSVSAGGLTPADRLAEDILRARRVRTVLELYASKERYFLVTPQGGVPMEDFAWYEGLRREFR